MIDRISSSVLGLVLAVSVPASPLSWTPAQSASPAAPFARLERWAALVNAHAPGERDEAADAASRLSGRELGEVFDEFQEAVRLFERALAEARALDYPINRGELTTTVAGLGAVLQVPAAEFVAVARTDREEATRLFQDAVRRLLERGALLHADVATVVPPELRLVSAVEPDAKASLLVQDGRAAGLERTAESHVSTHFAFGSRLIDLAAERTGRSELTRQWYRSTAAYLLRHEAFADAMTHLDRAADTLPTDAVVSFLTGALHEVFALPRSQAVVQSVELPPGMEHDVGTVDAELRIARSHYRRALELEPGFTLAAVHLARVTDLTGDHEAARAMLAEVRPSVTDRPTQYFAELFLGDASARLGEFAEAQRHYARAAALYPRAQTPGLAQSALLRARGDREGAVTAMRQVISRRVGRSLTDDPWWTYFIAHVADADARMVELGRALAEGVAR